MVVYLIKCVNILLMNLKLLLILIFNTDIYLDIKD